MKAAVHLAPRSLVWSAFGVLLAFGPAWAAGPELDPRQLDPPELLRYHAGSVQHGGHASGLAKAAADSFNLYGGVRVDGTNDRRPEGQFQTPIFFPDEMGWFGVDRTENPTFWHASAFNAENLTGVVGNRAMWSGVEPGTSGFNTPPGYGNNWNDVLLWRSQTNPTVNTQVRLAFIYNHDTEPGYDFFFVEYDSAGTWIPWMQIDGTNKDGSGVFTVPRAFDDTVEFTPLMYTGQPKTDVRLRVRVQSDGAWSDEDGLWPTRGAAQVDQIRVWFNGILVTANGDDGIATFEDLGIEDDTEGWAPESAAFAGDFAKVIPQLRDIDPCRNNLSPQLAFVDDGTPPRNSSVTTGGTTSPNWSYGVRGGWIVNYNGGISFGEVPLNNEYWSPEIAWDDSTTAEEDLLIGGAFMRFNVWSHLPLPNGMFWVWHVRSKTQSGDWSPWADRNFVYYGGGVGAYINVQADVTDLLESDPSHVQMALGVTDLADAFGFAGDDATPSPTFDNVSFWRYNLGGPAFATRNIDLFNDGFPNGGSLDLGDPGSLSVRIDMARDVSTGTLNAPGDSIIVDVAPTVPGSALAGAPVMKWVLEANPLFDGVRQLPAGVVNEGPSPRGWTRYTGTVLGDSSRTSAGAAVDNRFYFDAPNDGPAIAGYQGAEPAMFFPGDRFRYYIEATDDLGNTTTFPGNISGFLDGDGYSRVFTVRALPSVVNPGAGVVQPEVLVINDFGHRGGEASFLGAFAQNGLAEDVDFDVYTVRGPSSLVSNGIGSAGAHGATAQQLAGYDVLLYLSGNLSDGLISDGSNANGNDKGNDVETLTQWHNLAGDRYMAYFGDELSSFLAGSGPTAQTYLATIMSVSVADNDVRDELNGQAASVVRPTGAEGGLFAINFVAFGGCLGINQFDSISALAPAVSSHEFIDNITALPFAPSASVWHERTQQVDAVDYARVDLTFPHGFQYVYDVISPKAPVNISARSILLKEILEAFGKTTNPGGATGVLPSADRLFVHGNVPNPFNPSTDIRFTAPTRGEISVKVFNLRGELVRTLVRGPVDAGSHSVTWDGTDATGARVSSGVYLYEVSGFGDRVTGKMALVK